jgi:hypothetical protein
MHEPHRHPHVISAITSGEDQHHYRQVISRKTHCTGHNRAIEWHESNTTWLNREGKSEIVPGPRFANRLGACSLRTKNRELRTLSAPPRFPYPQPAPRGERPRSTSYPRQSAFGRQPDRGVANHPSGSTTLRSGVSVYRTPSALLQ